MATNNIVPLYPEISPQHIRDTAYCGCLKWLDGELWSDILPKQNPPQQGSEAVRTLGATLKPMQRIAFVDGWNKALKERGEWVYASSALRKEHWFVLALGLCLAFWYWLVSWL
jgi:hypothetical protein